MRVSSCMDYESIYGKIKADLKNFGERPVRDAGAILNAVQLNGVAEGKIEHLVQKIYIQLFVEHHRGDLNQARQSWVVASGNNFEDLIRKFINENLNAKGIVAIKGDKIRRNPKTEKIVQFLTLRANRRCVQTTTGVWPDSDILLLTKDQDGEMKIFALLNCKTSDHSRNDAVLFWALALRDNNIKYCLMTQDLDNRFTKGDNNSQISSIRRKCEAYLDRVYTTNLRTDECSQVRILDFNSEVKMNRFLDDLKSWRKEVVADFSSDLFDETSLL